MATGTNGDDKGKEVLLPADELAAIYDDDTKLLYLYASGKYPTPALTSFNRRLLLGGLKYAFEGSYTNGKESVTAEEQHFAEKFPINLNDDKFRPKTVTIVISGGPGIAPQNKEVDIVYVPVPQ